MSVAARSKRRTATSANTAASRSACRWACPTTVSPACQDGPGGLGVPHACLVLITGKDKVLNNEYQSHSPSQTSGGIVCAPDSFISNLQNFVEHKYAVDIVKIIHLPAFVLTLLLQGTLHSATMWNWLPQFC